MDGPFGTTITGQLVCIDPAKVARAGTDAAVCGVASSEVANTIDPANRERTIEDGINGMVPK